MASIYNDVSADRVLHVTRCEADGGHLQIIAVDNSAPLMPHAVPVCIDDAAAVQLAQDILGWAHVPGRPGFRGRFLMDDLITEKVSENYEPRPGVMGTRTFWIAYPGHVGGYGHMEDRISHAAGIGATREAALADAEESS